MNLTLSSQIIARCPFLSLSNRPVDVSFTHSDVTVIIKSLAISLTDVANIIDVLHINGYLHVTKLVESSEDGCIWLTITGSALVGTYQSSVFFFREDYETVLSDMPKMINYDNGKEWCDALSHYGLRIGAQPSGLFGLGVLTSSQMGKAFYDIVAKLGNSVQIDGNPSIEDQLIAVWNHYNNE